MRTTPRAIPAFIPDEKQLSSMQAFRDAVLNYKPFQNYFMDDMCFMREQDTEIWHEIFSDYHEVMLEHGHVAVAVVSDGHMIDDAFRARRHYT